MIGWVNFATCKCLRVFTYEELQKSTKNFSKSFKLGDGGLGKVYKGVIKSLDDPHDDIFVAIKRSDEEGGLQELNKWVTEVNIFGDICHPNLVKIIGYYVDEKHRILVYEFMENGNLADMLQCQSAAPPALSWNRVLKVAQDVASALQYLHEGLDGPIIYRYLKPHNILFDSKWNAKLSDFGYARLGPVHVTPTVGAHGYVDPNYVNTGKLRTDCDVWSFGVLLFVLITGRHAINLELPANEQNLVEWVKPFLHGDISSNVDKRITGVIPQSLQELALLAESCVKNSEKDRPNMGLVLNTLNDIVNKYEQTPIPIPISPVSQDKQTWVRRKINV